MNWGAKISFTAFSEQIYLKYVFKHKIQKYIYSKSIYFFPKWLVVAAAHPPLAKIYDSMLNLRFLPQYSNNISCRRTLWDFVFYFQNVRKLGLLICQLISINIVLVNKLGLINDKLCSF